MMKPRGYWQVSAGRSGRDYSDIFIEHDVMLIGPGHSGPYSAERYPGIKALRRFHDEAAPGDIVFMRRGAKVVSVGVVTGGYEYHDAFDDIYGWQLQHTRRVTWQGRLKDRAVDEFGKRKQMPCFGRVKRPSAALLQLAEQCSERALEQLPEVPSESLTPSDLLPLLAERGLADPARVCEVLEHHRKLVAWYRTHADVQPKEQEVVAYLVLPLLRALGWEETQLAIEWAVVNEKLNRRGRADLAAFDAPSRAAPHCVMLCEAKAMSSGLGNTLPQPEWYAGELPNCRTILTTQGTRFGVYRRNEDGSWPKRPQHYLNIERLRTQYAFPRGTNAVEALLALRPEAFNVTPTAGQLAGAPAGTS
jgi:hypothetical protein